jgi:hypothetical protein
VENNREMARDETNVKPKLKKKKKRRKTTKFFRPVHEGRRGPDAKREMKKINEMETAKDRWKTLDDEHEAKKRRSTAIEAVKAAEKGRRALRRLLQGGTNAAEGEVWTDGEVSFSHEAHQERDEAEALDTGGRR